MIESQATAAPQTGAPATVEPAPAVAGEPHARRPGRRLAYVALVAALVWVVLIRIPLVMNAAIHLDSDLAVDGLTLRDAVQGQWRWHYPGTPYMGIVPVFFSWPQAVLFGTNPITLVSGGTVAYVLLVLATFALAFRAFGPSAAAWSLLPLTFASTGAIWLSGRVTGGHLTSAIWHALAFLLLYVNLARGGWWPALALGLWSGLGLYVDSMFVLTLAGLVPAAAWGWWVQGKSREGLFATLLFVPALLAGLAPRELGNRVDPYDAYPGQFQTISEPLVLLEHLRLLGLECLPRLITGHRLPDLHADPDPAALGNPGVLRAERDTHPVTIAVTVVVMLLFLASLRALADPESTRGDRPAAAVRWGLIVSAVVTLGAFLINRNIFNSDNYRYLVCLLVPWALGFGLSMRGLAAQGRIGLAVAGACGLTLATLMTLDTARWYEQFAWVDSHGLPVRKQLDDPVLAWLNEHRNVTHFVGGYWDVYRLSFLANRPIRGIPTPNYPNRFPEWSHFAASDPSRIVYIRRNFEGRSMYGGRRRYSRGRLLDSGPGFAIYTLP